MQSNSLVHLRVGVCFPMLPHHTYISSIRSLDLCPEERQTLANMNHLTNDSDLRSCRYGPKPGDVEVATHAPHCEFPWLRDTSQDNRRQGVDERRGTPSMKSAQGIAHFWGHVDQKGDFRRRTAGCGLEAEVRVGGTDIPILMIQPSARFLVPKKYCEVPHPQGGGSF